MFLSFQRAISLFTLMGAMILMFGCSGGSTTPVVPASGDIGNDDTFTNQETIYEGEKSLGAFSLTLDSSNVSASIQPIGRQNAMNVSQYVHVEIQGLSWDAATRNWDIEVSVENTTNYNGFGPWVVFNVLGEQRILGQDGFIWWINDPGDPPERIPVVAFAKNNAQRIFHANSVKNFHVRIHWPPGWNTFDPIEFFIDASYPGPRQHPIVENLHIEPLAVPESYNLTAYIHDWQPPPFGGPGLEAWVDLSPIGGSEFHPLFDDGQHGDGAPGDSTWGTYFDWIPDPNSPRCFTVHAVDWESYHHENDVCYHAGPQPGCLPMEVIDQGPMGFRHPIELIVRNQDTWLDIWSEIHPNQDPPPINFEIHQAVVVGLGERISSGFSVHVDCVWQGLGPGNEGTDVRYTEEIPAPECQVEDVVTFPYQIVITPQTIEPDNFTHNEHVYHCPPPPECVDIRPLVDGNHSNILEPVERMFTNQWEWHAFWNQHNPDPSIPPPEVDWTRENAIALMTGQRNTGGYWIEVNCVKLLNDPNHDPVTLVEWTEMIPAEGCPVPRMITQPFNFFAVPKLPESRDDYIKHEVIYECPNVCMEFSVIEEGDSSNLPYPREEYITTQAQLQQFWNMHAPATDPPIVNWEEEQVVAIMLGNRQTNGFWVRVDCIKFINDMGAPPFLNVEYTEMVPGEHCVTADIITQPHIIVKIPAVAANSANFIHNEELYHCPPPPECQPIREIEEGNHSLITEPRQELFTNYYEWYQFWMEHGGDFPYPEVNWQNEMVVVLMTGQRETGGFWVRVDCVSYHDSDPGQPPWINVEWTEMIPGEHCEVPQEVTQPYLFFAIPRINTTAIDFNKSEEVYQCEPPNECVPMETIQQGNVSGIHDNLNTIIRNDDQWFDFWRMHDPNTQPPPINFDQNMVIAVMGGEHPTTGYEVEIDCVRFINDPAAITHVGYSVYIPGQRCVVENILTYPFHIVAVPWNGAEGVFWGEEVVYECN